MGEGQGAKLAAPNSVEEPAGKAAKAESRGGVTSYLPKQGRKWITDLIFLGQRAAFKTEWPTLLEEELTKQSCS
jgi:hypothetical protein